MSTRSDPLFDQRVADWLEADPDRAPAQVLATVLAAAPSIPQRRATAPWSEWARPFQFMAAAILVIAVSIGGFVALRGLGYGAAPTPTPVPTPTQSPAPTQPVVPASNLVPFESGAYAYKVSYPSNWLAHSSPGRLEAPFYPYDYSQGVDYFSATSPTVSDPGLIIAGPTIEAGASTAAWAADIVGLQATNMGCAAPDASEDLQIGGEPGVVLTWLDCPAYLLWAGVVHGDRAYHIIWIDQYAIENPALQAADKALFDKIVASFVFNAPASSASPSASP